MPARQQPEHLDLPLRQAGRAGAPRSGREAGCRQHRRDVVRVEPTSPGLRPQPSGRLLGGQRGPVRAVFDQGPVGVGGGEHARARRQLAASRAAVVAAAVAALVMLPGERRHLGQLGDPGEDPLAVVRMQPGLVALGDAQRRRLVPDAAGDADPPEIVQVPGDAHGPDLLVQPSSVRRRRQGRPHRRSARAGWGSSGRRGVRTSGPTPRTPRRRRAAPGRVPTRARTRTRRRGRGPPGAHRPGRRRRRPGRGRGSCPRAGVPRRRPLRPLRARRTARRSRQPA